MRLADADVPIKYMDRTRHYYRALGYTRDYIWATSSVEPLEIAKVPRTTVKAPFSWKEDGVVWRARYGRVDSPIRGVCPRLVRSDAGNKQRQGSLLLRPSVIPGLLHADPSEEADA